MRRRRLALLLLAATLAPAARAAAAVLDPVEIAAGVWVMRGTGGMPDRANLGRIGNSGFIVGRIGVLAIDTGASAAHGEAILEAIRGVTALPVRLALLTSARPEFALGASAFRARGIPVAMHAAAAPELARRFEADRQALADRAGDEAARGTAPVVPDIVFTDPLSVDAAAMIGRSLQILDIGVAIGPGDVAVFDPRTRTLFAGPLVEAGRVPDLAEGDPAAWRDVLGTLKALPIEEIVPGHGPTGDLRLVVRMDRYLVAVSGSARDSAAAVLPEFAGWDNYSEQHPRNVARLARRAQATSASSPRREGDVRTA